MSLPTCTKCTLHALCSCETISFYKRTGIVCSRYTAEVTKCGGCGRIYPPTFPECPFCYAEPFFQSEANDDGVPCPICHTVHEKSCRKCGRIYNDVDTYCLQCGTIRVSRTQSKKGY